MLVGEKMSNNVEKFAHRIKTPLSTISVAVDSITPLVRSFVSEEELFDVRSFVSNMMIKAQFETVLKLLNNVQIAVEQINALILTLEDNE